MSQLRFNGLTVELDVPGALVVSDIEDGPKLAREHEGYEGRWIQYLIVRKKISRRGKKARETLEFDHTSRGKTIKLHQVEERA